MTMTFAMFQNDVRVVNICPSEERCSCKTWKKDRVQHYWPITVLKNCSQIFFISSKDAYENLHAANVSCGTWNSPVNPRGSSTKPLNASESAAGTYGMDVTRCIASEIEVWISPIDNRHIEVWYFSLSKCSWETGRKTSSPFTWNVLFD